MQGTVHRDAGTVLRDAGSMQRTVHRWRRRHLSQQLICELHQLIVSATELGKLILHTDCHHESVIVDIQSVIVVIQSVIVDEKSVIVDAVADIDLELLCTLISVCLSPIDCAPGTEILRNTTQHT